jgi:hypothetical protein
MKRAGVVDFCNVVKCEYDVGGREDLALRGGGLSELFDFLKTC